MGFSKLGYLESLRGADLTGSEFRVLVVMAGYADSKDGRNARPGNDRLAADCRLEERSVRRCLASLVAKGWLRQERRGGRNGAGVAWASSYELSKPGSTGHLSPLETGSQPDISRPSTGHPKCLSRTSEVSQPDTSAPPPVLDPVKDPVLDPVRAEHDPWAARACADCSRAITGDAVERPDGRRVCAECPPF